MAATVVVGGEGGVTLHISGSVGEGGVNSRNDVWNVQVLLIKIRRSQGAAPIELDGRIGPETIGAIRAFQKRQFGWINPDGRVDRNGNTLKHLILLTDGSGQNKFLLDPVTVKQQGTRWEVKIGADGELFVKPGDWLSKYSAAIDGNFYTIWPYMRPKEDGKFYRIENPRMLKIGESLYHIPTFLAFRRKHDMPEVEVPTPVAMSDAEKQKMSEEFAKANFGLKGDNAKALGYALTGVEVGASALEVAGLVVQGSVMAGIVTTASVAAVFASMVGSIISLINVLQTGQKLAGMRAVAYASVAWSFDDQEPRFSRVLEQRMRVGGAVTESEIARCKRAWADAVRETKKELERKALGPYGYAKSLKTQKVLIRAAKKRLRLIEGENRRKLSQFIMRSFDGQLSGTELVAWQRSRNEYAYNE